jgi:hypothetical protein
LKLGWILELAARREIAAGDKCRLGISDGGPWYRRLGILAANP